MAFGSLNRWGVFHYERNLFSDFPGGTSHPAPFHTLSSPSTLLRSRSFSSGLCRLLRAMRGAQQMMERGCVCVAGERRLDQLMKQHGDMFIS
eukprot:3522821-Rhodomonas_salina.1